jgi:predicted RNase H-like HicB family nuclease
MKKKEFSVVIEKDEDGYYVGSVPELKGCHTQAKSLYELMGRVKEAIVLCLEVEGLRGWNVIPAQAGIQVPGLLLPQE